MKNFLKYLLTFCILIFSFNVILLLVSTFSSELMKENVRESSEILKKEGNRYALSKFFNIVNNNYTDAIIVNAAYSIDNENPVYSYMTARRNYKKGITKKELPDIQGELNSLKMNSIDEFTEKYDPVGELYNFLNGEIIASINYARYWHGNLVLFRPLLLIFNIMEIRTLLFGIFLILFIYFIYLLAKKFDKRIAFIFAISLICNGYFSASYSLESSPIFLVMILSSIFLLKKIDKIENFSLYIFAVACIANFVDFLTVPLITLGIPMLIWFIDMQNKEKSLKECIIFIIKNSIIWLLGYALTWITKWIIYDLMFDGEIINICLQQITHRTQRTSELVTKSFFETMKRVFGLNLVYIFCLAFFEVFFKIKLNSKKELIESIPYFIIALMPIVWYVVLANHTIIHIHFTYRHMIIFLCAFYLGINKSLNIKPKYAMFGKKK